jgi:hypothetical protein
MVPLWRFESFRFLADSFERIKIEGWECRVPPLTLRRIHGSTLVRYQYHAVTPNKHSQIDATLVSSSDELGYISQYRDHGD